LAENTAEEDLLAVRSRGSGISSLVNQPSGLKVVTMSRLPFAWIAAFGLLGFAGCSMCANTYDECGPTWGGGCGHTCGMEGRAGSVLSGGDPMVDSGESSGQTAVQVDKTVGAPGLKPPTGQLAPIPAEGWKASRAAGS